MLEIQLLIKITTFWIELQLYKIKFEQAKKKHEKRKKIIVMIHLQQQS